MPHFTTSDGLNIHYEVHGSGPPVLLLHGFASSGRINWVSTGWTESLAGAGFRAIVPDQRGHGRSDAPHDPARYGVPRMAADALELLDHLELPRAALMGYSLGARVAAFAAASHPRRVGVLVLSGMAANLMRELDESGAIAAALEAEDGAAASPRAAAFRAFAERTGADLKALAACMRAGRLPITEEMLQRLSMPVLVVVGERDEIAGPPKPLLRHLPHAESLVLPGRDHMNAVGDRGHREAVIDFLSRHGGLLRKI